MRSGGGGVFDPGHFPTFMELALYLNHWYLGSLTAGMKQRLKGNRLPPMTSDIVYRKLTGVHLLPDL